jgi:hypothetical protein
MGSFGLGKAAPDRIPSMYRRAPRSAFSRRLSSLIGEFHSSLFDLDILIYQA